MDNSIKSNSTVVYPYCYKIKEDCLPCDNTTDLTSVKPGDNTNTNTNIFTTDCIDELSRIAKNKSRYISSDIKDKYSDDLFNCLKKYGDIYKKLGIELYVNPKTKAIQFPDNQRIQSNLNLYLEQMDPDTKSPKNSLLNIITIISLIIPA
jgi:hypothetical protein